MEEMEEMEERGNGEGDRNILLRVFISNPALFVNTRSHEHAQQIYRIDSIDTILSLRNRVIDRLKQISSIPSHNLYWFKIVFQNISWADVTTNTTNKSDLQQNKNLKSDIQKQDARLFSMQLRRNATPVKSAVSRPEKTNNRVIRRFYIPSEHENVVSVIMRQEQNVFCRGTLLVCLVDIRSLWNSSPNGVDSLPVKAINSNDGIISINNNLTDFITLPAFHPTSLIAVDNFPANISTLLSYDVAYLGSSGSFLQLSLDGCAMAQLSVPSLSSSAVNTTSTSSAAVALFLPPLSGSAQNTIATSAAYSQLQLGQVAADAFFWEIANTAVIQGMLQRKVWIGSKGQEAWRPLYFLLEPVVAQSSRVRKLWFFGGQAGKDQNPPSFILLSKKGKRKDRVRIEISEKDSTVLVLWGCRDSWDRVYYDVDTKDKVQPLGPFSEAICLKAKTDYDALMWCTQLQHALDETDCHVNIKEITVAGLGVDNDLLAAIDDQITVTECRHASLENEPVQGLRTLRGTLSNRLLRRLFQNFLRVRWPIHWLLLLLYEQLCDFLYHSSTLSTKETSNHEKIAPYRLWARRICDAFLSERLLEGLVSHIDKQGSTSSGGNTAEALILVKQELLLLRDELLDTESTEKHQGSGIGSVVVAIRKLRRKLFQHLQQTTHQSFMDSSLSRSGAIALISRGQRFVSESSSTSRATVGFLEEQIGPTRQQTSAPASTKGRSWGFLGRNSVSSPIPVEPGTLSSSPSPNVFSELSTFAVPWRSRKITVSLQQLDKDRQAKKKGVIEIDLLSAEQSFKNDDINVNSNPSNNSSNISNKGWRSFSFHFRSLPPSSSSSQSNTSKSPFTSNNEWDISGGLPDLCWMQSGFCDPDEGDDDESSHDPVIAPEWFPSCQGEVRDTTTPQLKAVPGNNIHIDILLDKHMQQLRSGQVSSTIYVETVDLARSGSSPTRQEPPFVTKFREFKLQQGLEAAAGSDRQPVDFLKLFPAGGLGQVLFSGVLKCRHFAAVQNSSTTTNPGRRTVTAAANSSSISNAAPTGLSSASQSPQGSYSSRFDNSNSPSSNVSILKEVATRYICDSADPIPGSNPVLLSRSSSFSSSSNRANPISVPNPKTNSNSNTSSNLPSTPPGDWSRQLGMLTTCLGSLRLHLFNLPIAGTTTGTAEMLLPGKHTACIDLTSAIRVAPCAQQLHAIDLFTVTGLSWQFCPEGLDEDDTRSMSARWLETIAIYSVPATDVVILLRSGYLQKRGEYNTAYKSRWFVLSSDYKLRYYTDDGGAFKGEIDLRTVDRTITVGNLTSLTTLPSTKSVVRFQREIVISMHQKLGRLWRLQASDEREAESWVNILNQLLLARDGDDVNVKRLQQGIRALDGDFSDHEEDEDEDEEDGGSRKRERRARERGATESSLLDEEEEVEELGSDKDDKSRVDSRVRFSMPTLGKDDTNDELSRIQPQLMEYIVGDAEEDRFSTF